MKLKYVLVVLLLIGFISGASAGEISFNAVTNVITVTGFTQANPCTFLDVFNADVAGGWGKVNQITPYSYYINGACFYLGNATHNGYFADVSKQIILKLPAGKINLFDAFPNRGYLEFGEIDNTFLKTTKNGCNFVLEGNVLGAATDFCINPAELYLYGCKIERYIWLGKSRVWLENTNGSIWQTHFNNGYYLYKKANNLDISDLTISNTVQISNEFRSDLPVNKVNGYNIAGGMGLFGQSSTNIGICIINTNYIFWCMAATGDHYLIDCEFDWGKPCFFWNSGIYKVKRQYTYNLKTTPNAKITIMNHTDIVYQGYAYDNGTIDEQILTMGHYTKSTGSILNSQNPYRLEISKPGYQTYTNTFTLDAPIIWNIGLEPERIPLDKSGIVTGLGFLIGCMIVSIGLIIMKRREFL